jgi:1,4-alpha-glucan branching enzyme
LASEVIAEEKKLAVVSTPIQLGPNQVEDRIILRYYDPIAQDVQIAGDFSNWEPVENIMVQQKENKIWKGTVQLKPGKYQYKFIVDGEWKIDPCNPEVMTSDVGVSNSLLIVSEH